MHIIYELTKKDFAEAYQAHRDRTGLRKWTRQISIGITGIFTALILFVLLVKPNAPEATAMTPYFGLVSIWLLLTVFLPRWNIQRQFTKQPGAHGARTLLLDASGMHWRWNGGSSDVEWKNYIRLVEGKSHFLFYTSPACFDILPRRALGPEQLTEVRQLLKQNIGG